MKHLHVEAYKCELCGTRYQEASLALACEAAGAPQPRYRIGDAVVVSDGDYRDQFRGAVFQVTASDIFLDKPGLDFREQGTPGNHMVVYVIGRPADGVRVTFVPQHHLAPAGGTTHA